MDIATTLFVSVKKRQISLDMYFESNMIPPSGGSRISHRGAWTHKGAWTPDVALFGKSVCENKRIGSGRGRAPGTPPLDPPMPPQVIAWSWSTIQLRDQSRLRVRKMSNKPCLLKGRLYKAPRKCNAMKSMDKLFFVPITASLPSLFLFLNLMQPHIIQRKSTDIMK